MRKLLVGLGLCLLATSVGFGQFGGAGEFSFKAFGGFSLAQTKGLSQYTDYWDGQVVSDIEEYADIDYKANNGVAFGGALTYMFGPNFGLEIGAALFSQKIPNSTLAGWDFSFAGYSYGEEYEFSGEGKMTVVPIFLNLVGRFSSGLMDFNLSAGPTLYLNSAEATATGLFGDNYWWVETFWWGTVTYEALDFFPLAAEVPSTKWTSFGFNVGASVDFNLSPMMALFLDVRYFFCPKRDLDWTYLAGTYDGMWENLYDWEIYQDQADYAADLTTPYQVNPSFFAISGGLKIRFGGSAPY